MQWLARLPTIFILLQLIALSISAEYTRYVRPSTLPSKHCPKQQCLTLEQYVEKADKYFTTGSTFIFLSGNHSLQTSLELVNATDIILRGEHEDPDINILCTIETTFKFDSVTNLTIECLTFILRSNKHDLAAAITVLNSREMVIYNSTFLGSGNSNQTTACAVNAVQSNITICHCLFEGNTGTIGGSIFVEDNCYLVVSGSTFTRNQGGYSGGAIYVGYGSTAFIRGKPQNRFLHNSGGYSGGALDCEKCIINITGTNSFEDNRLSGPTSGGGAIGMVWGDLIISGTVQFLNNEAKDGGAISLIYSSALLGGESVVFAGNLADQGGGMSFRWSVVKTSAKVLNYTNNTARSVGGALSIGTSEAGLMHDSLAEISATFVSNRGGQCGGAVFVERETVEFINVEILANSDSALCVYDSNITFTGSTQLLNNIGGSGGAISSKNSLVTFTGDTWFDGNIAQEGGAINALQGEIALNGYTTFTGNIARTDGGALYALGTSTTFKDTVSFTLNIAQNGGAMHIGNGASLYMTFYTHLNTSNNFAFEYGGAIYHKDSATSDQCNFKRTNSGGAVQFLPLPFCFLKSRGYSYGIMYSFNDSAELDGGFLYGGLLDKCRPNEMIDETVTLYYQLSNYVLTITSQGDTTVRGMSSPAYELCFCDSNQVYDCSRSISIEVFRGQTFTVSLIAIGQGKIVTSTQVTAVSQNSRLKILQNSQFLPQHCSRLTYNLYSMKTSEKLILYPDGACRESGLSSVLVNVTFRFCPGGFSQFGEACICEERLQAYNTNCTIDDSIQITKRASSKFWMGALYDTNGSYEGLILYKTCPSEYCKSETIVISLDDVDVQCDLNRSGVLCGACTANHSLMLGSSRCEICSNTYLTLLFAFACAGIVLVVFLTSLRLTVATGTLNSLILYANIVQVNRKLFLPQNTVNILTIFIAWMNLDLGIETCFFDGMNAFVETCLQFSFPVFVWILITVIILTSRHSVIMSRLIGSNPIAVLATLLLMSYTKILRIVIEVYSSVDLDYPGNKKVTVWLKDANVPYLRAQHLLLTVITSLVLVTLFLPYTLLLLLGHKLYHFTGRKYFSWLNRAKPLLESYYAPYKIHTRYWTGFLLLVRCALYMVFSFFGSTSKSLVAIIITFTSIGFIASGRIYKRFAANAVEGSVYFNLVLLSTATLTEHNTPALVYILLGAVFATMMGLSMHQFHILYTAKTGTWLKINAKITQCRLKFKTVPDAQSPVGIPSHDPHRIVSRTVVCLREPLLDT